MNRPLTDKEIEATNKGKKFLEESKTEQLQIKEYAEKKIELLKKQWEFDDWSRPIERAKTLLSASRTIKEADSDLELIEKKIEQLDIQLKEGVEVKTPIGVWKQKKY